MTDYSLSSDISYGSYVPQELAILTTINAQCKTSLHFPGTLDKSLGKILAKSAKNKYNLVESCPCRNFKKNANFFERIF